MFLPQGNGKFVVAAQPTTGGLIIIMKMMMIKKISAGVFVAIVAAHTASCATGSPPRHEMELTQTSIRSAEAAGAVSHASKPLRAAQQKVSIAQTLIDKEKYDEAKHQLHLAIADAELAEATAEARKSELAREELSQSIDLLKKEIARAQEN